MTLESLLHVRVCWSDVECWLGWISSQSRMDLVTVSVCPSYFSRITLKYLHHVLRIDPESVTSPLHYGGNISLIGVSERHLVGPLTV